MFQDSLHTTDHVILAFPKREEFDKARNRLERLALPFDVTSPDPAYRNVGVPALTLTADTLRAVYENAPDAFVASGWVEYRPARITVPDQPPPSFDEDVFGTAVVMTISVCVADRSKIRIIAHISGDMAEVFPYMNAEMREASYNPEGETLTFMDGYRMVCLYPHRIAIAKADDLVDAWRGLEAVRQRVNTVWARRHEITPSHEKRMRPPALEILKRLPMSNCRACGELTCTAFAVKVWQAETPVFLCAPVFSGEFSHLKEALLEICSGLGVGEGEATEKAI